jgi:tetratricopeptide (TPR) repeat protein
MLPWCSSLLQAAEPTHHPKAWAWLSEQFDPTQGDSPLAQRLTQLSQAAEYTAKPSAEAQAERLLLAWYSGHSLTQADGFEALLAKAPRWHWATRFVLAQLDSRRGQHQRAANTFAGLVVEPSPLQAASAMGWCYSSLQALVGRSPYLRPWLLLGTLLQAFVYLGQLMANQAVSVKGVSWVWLSKVAWAWLLVYPQRHLTSNPEPTLAWLDAQRRRYPGCVWLAQAWLTLLLVAKRPQQASFWLDEALQRHPNNLGIWQLKAQWALHTQQADEALTTLEHLIRNQPQHAAHYEWLASLHWQQGRKAQAMQCLSVVLTLETQRERKAKLALTLAEWLHQNQQADAALGYVHLALSLCPRLPEAKQWLMALLREQHAYLALEAHCQWAAAQQPDQPGLWATSLGYVAGESQHHQRAKRLYLEALHHDANDQVAANNLACLYLEVFHEPRQAEALLKRLLNTDDSITLAHFNLGRALSAQGKTVEAAAAYERARQLNHTSHDLDDTDLANRLSELF